MMLPAKFCIVISARCPKINLHSNPRVRMGPALSTPWVTTTTPGFVHLLKCLIGFQTTVCKIFLVILCHILLLSACIYIFIYSFIYLGFHLILYFVYVISYGIIFECILSYMIMCLLLSASSTHFK